MAKTVDYYFSPMSPWTYLGHQRFTDLLARASAQVKSSRWTTGGSFPFRVACRSKQRAPQRQAYRLLELRRWRDFTGGSAQPRADAFPLCRRQRCAPDRCRRPPARHAGSDEARTRHLESMLGRERNCADAGTLDQIAAAAGMDGYALRSRESEAKVAYDAYTQEAIGPAGVRRAELRPGRRDFLGARSARSSAAGTCALSSPRIIRAVRRARVGPEQRGQL
mgnify:CR=1 FL=1